MPLVKSAISPSEDFSQSPTPKKDKKRLVAACIACRKKKIKCSGARPACQHCLRLNILCEYPVVRNRGSRFGYFEQLNQRLQALKSYYRPNGDGKDSFQDGDQFNMKVKPGDDAHMLMKSVKRPLSSSADSTMTSNTNFSDALSPIDLPPLEVVIHLMELYFTNINIQTYSFLHKPTFMPRLRRGQVSKSLVFAICAAAARYSKHPAITNGRPPYTFGEVYATKARRLIGFDFDIPSLEIVQALICLIQHEFFRSRGGKAMIYISMAIPLALYMGLDKEPPDDLLWHEKESRRRTFWSLVVLDRLTHATPHYAIQLPELYDVRLPCPHHLFLNNVKTTVPFLNDKDMTEASNKGIFAYYVEAIILWNNINRYASGEYKDEKISPWEPGSNFQNLLQDFDALYASIPLKYKYSRTRLMELAGAGRVGHYMHLHTGLWASRFVLFRTMYPYDSAAFDFGPPPKQFVEDAAFNMRQAANDLSTLVSDVLKVGDITIAPFVGFCVFTVSPLHIALSFSQDSQVAMAAKQNLANNMKLLVELREYFYVVGVWCVILKDSYVRNVKSSSVELTRPGAPPTYLPEDLLKYSGDPPSALNSPNTSPRLVEPVVKKVKRSTEAEEFNSIELLQDEVLTEPWLKNWENNNFMDLSTLYGLEPLPGAFDQQEPSPGDQSLLENIFLQIPIETSPEFGLDGFSK